MEQVTKMSIYIRKETTHVLGACRSALTALAQKIKRAVKSFFSTLIHLPRHISDFFNSFHHPLPLRFSKNKTRVFSKCAESSNLHRASFYHNNDQLEKLLENKHGHVDGNTNKVTPMHAAVCNGNLDGIKLLVAKGANIEARDVNGQTPFHWAAYHGSVPVINLLFILGADIDVRDLRNQTPLRIAAKHGFLDAVSTMVALGADLEAKDAQKQTPYFVARLYGRTKIARYLADVGADTQVVNNEGKNANEASGRGCFFSYIRDHMPFKNNELKPGIRKDLIKQVVMVA